MTNIKMPAPPPSHHWQVSTWGADHVEVYAYMQGRRDTEPPSRMAVRLMRQPARKWWGWLPDEQSVGTEVGNWGEDEEHNALLAVRLATTILKRPEVAPNHQLNGLSGYEWGGNR